MQCTNGSLANVLVGLMPRKPEGDKPMTTAERVSRHRRRQTEQLEALRAALRRIVTIKTAREAREIAEATLLARWRP
jgi:hypothetical protein